MKPYITIVYCGEYIPSINGSYRQFRNKKTGKTQRAKTDRHKKFTQHIRALTKLQGQILPSQWYELEVTFRLPIYTKSGDIRKWDVTNHVKAIEDAMSDALDIDDRKNLSVKLSKINGPWGFAARIRIIKGPLFSETKGAF